MWHDLILNGARALGRERATLPPIHLNRIFPPHRRHCDDMRRKCTKEKKSRAWHAFAHSHFHSIIIVVLLLGENSFSLKIASVFQLLKNHNKKKSFENPLCIHMHDYFNTTKKLTSKWKILHWTTSHLCQSSKGFLIIIWDHQASCIMYQRIEPHTQEYI